MALYFDEIIWLDWVVDKLEQKHGVTTADVEQAFKYSPSRLLQAGMGKYKLLSRSSGGRYLMIVFAWEGPNVLIITARDMDQKERRIYMST